MNVKACNIHTSCAGMLYPEFQYRRPPPSYTASMQEYQNQLTPPPDESSGSSNPVQSNGGSLPGSPPPSYRSRASTAHSGVLNAFPRGQDGDHSNSRPPTYRSRAPSRRPSLPRDGETQHNVSDNETGNRTVQDVSFVESSETHVLHSGAETDRVMAASASLTFSHLPSSGPSSITNMWSDSSSRQLASSSEVSQVYTVPLRSSSHIDNQNLVSVHDTQNFTTDLSQPSPNHQQDSITSSSARPPSLHQRMASEDCRILEQTLRSLEDHMNERAGIMNEGASFDDQDQTTDRVNTYL